MAKSTNRPSGLTKIKEVRAYNPGRGYTWKPDDIFALNGNEFGALYQALKNEIYVPGGISASQKVETFKLIDEILKRHYEAGVGEEVPPQPEQQQN